MTGLDAIFAQLVGTHEDVLPASYVLESDVCTLGRAASCHIIVSRNIVSRLHAQIERSGPRYLLRDIGSANGTFINGQRLSEPHLLAHKDSIGLGSPEPLLSFVDPDPTFRPVPVLRYDNQAQTFYFKEQRLNLSLSLLRLFNHLYTHQGALCSRESCAHAVWGRDYDPGLDADALNELIYKLRTRLRAIDPAADLIKGRPSVGYILELDIPTDSSE